MLRWGEDGTYLYRGASSSSPCSRWPSWPSRCTPEQRHCARRLAAVPALARVAQLRPLPVALAVFMVTRQQDYPWMSSTARFWLRVAVTFAPPSSASAWSSGRSGTAQPCGGSASGGPTTICGRGPGAGSRSGRSRRCCGRGRREPGGDGRSRRPDDGRRRGGVRRPRRWCPRGAGARGRRQRGRDTQFGSGRGHPPTQAFLVASRSSATRRPPRSSGTPKGLGSTLDLDDGALDGCGLYDEGSIHTTANFRRVFGNCEGWPDEWAEAAADGQAQITLVVLGAWDVFDLDRDDGLLRFATPEYGAYVTTQLQRGRRAGRRGQQGRAVGGALLRTRRRWRSRRAP